MKTVSFTDFSAFPPVIFRRETVELQCCVKWKQSFIQKKSVFIQENFLAGEKNSYLRKNLKPVIETPAQKHIPSPRAYEPTTRTRSPTPSLQKKKISAVMLAQAINIINEINENNKQVKIKYFFMANVKSKRGMIGARLQTGFAPISHQFTWCVRRVNKETNLSVIREVWEENRDYRRTGAQPL